MEGHHGALDADTVLRLAGLDNMVLVSVLRVVVCMNMRNRREPVRPRYPSGSRVVCRVYAEVGEAAVVFFTNVNYRMTQLVPVA